MEIIVEKGCGLDVHKETVVACIMGEGIKKEIRTYSAMTNDLLKLKEWLKETGITHVAMESTGIYWKPVFNILEDGFEVVLVNARHIKNVPGRKTDVKDSEWLCKLLRNGLVKAFHLALPSCPHRHSDCFAVSNVTGFTTILRHMERFFK